MATAFVVTVDKEAMDRELARIAQRITNVQPVLETWAAETGKEIGEKWNEMTFLSLFSGSRSFRGSAMWRSVPPMYVRKDGTEIPPWGGVKRVSRQVKWRARTTRTGERIVRDAFGVAVDVAKFTKSSTKVVYRRRGNVLGRKRPSGSRIKSLDVVGKDSQTMYRQFVREPRMAENKKSISLVSNTKYAPYQNILRAFTIAAPSDYNRLHRLYVEYLTTILKAIR